MMRSTRGTVAKFCSFVLIMSVLTVFLFFVFGQFRSGSTEGYTAIFTDASRLKGGDSVRVAGIRVGTVNSVKLRRDKTVAVSFDTDRNVVLTGGTKAAVRYLNLVGDRYLELVDSPGSNKVQLPGSEIPADRTAPALDLDLLLGGLKPVIQGLDPQDINALSGSLIQVFQGQGGTIESLLSRTSSFADALAANRETVQALIDNLRSTMRTFSEDGNEFSQAVDKLDQLVSSLSEDRDPIAAAIAALENGTASITDLLDSARPPLAGTVDQLNRLAPLLEKDKDLLDVTLQKAPSNFRKMSRVGAYGSFVQFYVCGLTVRASDLQGRTAVFPWIRQDTGRCAEPHE